MSKVSSQVAVRGGRTSTAAPPRLQPAPDAHARALIELYGMRHAARIATRNVRVTAPEDYWCHVLAAMQSESGKGRSGKRL
jgi:hypothetical protein